MTDVHPTLCGVSLAVMYVELNDWFFFFLLFLKNRLYRSHLPQWRQKHECLSHHTRHRKCCWTFDLFRKKIYKILFCVIKWFLKVTTNKNVQFTSSSHLCLKVMRTFLGVSFFTLVQYVQQSTVHNVHCISSASGFNSRQWLCKPLCQSTGWDQTCDL